MSGVNGGIVSHTHNLQQGDVTVATPALGDLRTIPATALFAIVEVGVTVTPSATEARTADYQVETGVGTGVYQGLAFTGFDGTATGAPTIGATSFIVPGGFRYRIVQGAGTGGVGTPTVRERTVTLATAGPA